MRDRLGRLETDTENSLWGHCSSLGRMSNDPSYTCLVFSFKSNRARVKEFKGITDSRFWDCECKSNYIHPKSVEVCQRCNCYREDMPDSIIDELRELKSKRGEKRFL